MKKNKSYNDFYVVNFFATPVIDYSTLIELQSKETSSPIYDTNK